MNQNQTMTDIVALCKRRGFVFPASDLYGGLNGFWDYGPLGVELKNNLRDIWWKAMVTTPPVGPDGHPLQIVGIDSSIIQNPAVWVASGHVGNFSDPMVDCRETKKRYRADHIVVLIPKEHDSEWIATFENDEEFTKGRLKKFAKGKSIEDFEKIILTDLSVDEYPRILAPDTNKIGTLTEPKNFNLMFETFVGAVQNDSSKAFLRPETAQGIFANYKNVLDSSRVKVPFGIAQIGKAFRNEVNPRNFIFRSREFEQMELEWFCHPDEIELWREFWFNERKYFWQNLGLSSQNIKIRDHDKDELSHYAKEGLGTADIEYRFPFTYPEFGELEGIAHRCDFDLKQHQKHSGRNMGYIDALHGNERFIPHVIEPASGLTRGVLALLCEAYTVDENRPAGVYLNFHPKIAPKKAAILPLTAKGIHTEIAEKVYMELREEYAIDLDIKQNIGKRYARQDEIGTPICFTIDNETIEDHSVTARDRNTMAQERISLENISEYLKQKLK